MNKSYNEEKENSCMHDFQYDRFIQISLLFVSRKQNENKSELETLKKNVTQQVCLTEPFKNLIALFSGINYCCYDCF